MKETERVARRRFETTDERPRRLEQHEGADDVGVDERPRAVNRSIDVRLRREVEHRGRPVFREDPGHRLDVRDVGLHEGDPRTPERRLQIAQAAGVGQLVENDETIGGMVEGVLDKVGADEAGSSGDEKCGHVKKKPRSTPRAQSAVFLGGPCALGG